MQIFRTQPEIPSGPAAFWILIIFWYNPLVQSHTLLQTDSNTLFVCVIFYDPSYFRKNIFQIWVTELATEPLQKSEHCLWNTFVHLRKRVVGGGVVVFLFVQHTKCGIAQRNNWVILCEINQITDQNHTSQAQFFILFIFFWRKRNMISEVLL